MPETLNPTISSFIHRDNKPHKLAFDGLRDGTKLAYYSKKKKVRVGCKMGSEILCDCCNEKMSPSQFEAHAGCGHRRKPYMNIYTSEGVSLHNLSISLSSNGHKSSENIASSSNGHQSSENIARVLCRGHEYCSSGFCPHTSLICEQCQKEYHVGCLKENSMEDLKEIPEGNWFCSEGCKSVHTTLHNLVDAGEHKPAVKKSFADAKWRLLKGADASEETKNLLSQAKAIFHNQFQSRGDFIQSLVYGEEKDDQDHSGMYCAVLTKGSKVVSVGILRVLGQEIAELPMAATLKKYQHKGYFTILFSCIVKLLALLNVENIVLPAVKEAESMWIEKFGFQKIPEKKLLEYNKVYWKMITFYGHPCWKKQSQY